jgi:valacyclovir hydrolase
MPEIEVCGFRCHYEQRGQGAPLLCLPGALGTGLTDFGPQIEELSDTFQVIAPDPRGYGRSHTPERSFTANFLQQDADDAAALMSALGCGAYFAAGWSDGATAAVLLAIAHPERVRKLVIWGGNSYVSAEDIELFERTRSICSWSPRMRASLEAIYGDRLQDLWTGWCDAMARLLEAGGEICRRRLERVQCPTLILHGARDPLVPEFHPQVFREGIRGSRLHVFPEGRHNIHLYYAAEFNRLVREFLAAG